MRKLQWWSVAIVVAAISGLASPATADLAEIKAQGRLRVLVSADELPHMFSFAETGKPGLEREMIQGFARAEGLEVQVVKVDLFERIIPSLLEGKGDVILGLIDTPKRRERIAFSIETLPARHVAANRKPAAPIESLEQLRGLRVGSVLGSSWSDAARAAGVPSSSLIEYDATDSMLQGLSSGGVDAVVMSVTDLAQAMRGDPALQPGLFVGPPASAAWGVRKEDRELRQALSEYLQSLMRSTSWGQMVLKYFTPEAVRLITQGKR